MGTSSTPDCPTRRRQREQRREQAQRGQAKESPAAPFGAEADDRARRSAARTCGWCGGPITPRSRGPIPKWCSATCRHRAWEQTRAAASGRAAVQVVERQVEVRVPAAPTRRDWTRLLTELTRQLDNGRVYDRDLAELAVGLGRVLAAYNRRPYVRDRNVTGTLPFLR